MAKKLLKKAVKKVAKEVIKKTKAAKKGKTARHEEYQYLDLLKDIMTNGFEKKEFNTGIAIKSVFGRSMRYDLSKGFPLLTTKKVFMKGIVHELIWFLQGRRMKMKRMV